MAGMWLSLGKFILKYRATILIILTVLTMGMSYFASKVAVKYDTSSAIPQDNEKYIEHQNFKKKFGEDGNMMVVGFDQKDCFNPKFFAAFTAWQQAIKNIHGVDHILAIPSAITIENIIIVNVPEGYTVDGLQDLNMNIDNASGTFISTTAVAGNKLTITTRKIYKNTFDKKEAWPNYIAFLEPAYKLSQAKVVLKKK